MTVLRLEEVSVRFKGREVLSSVSGEFGPGVHVVLGRNGAGKSTLFRAIAGLVDFEGEVYVDGRSLRRMSRREVARTVGYCWQNPYYGFIEQTVEEELRLILEATGAPGDARVVEILVPRELMDRNPYTLSGGEAKRVSMASVLVADQPVWLLDEPFSYLDRDGVSAVAELVEYGRRRGKTILVALHDTAYSSLLNPDSFTLLANGRFVARGGWRELSDEVLASAGVATWVELCGLESRR
ncbi:MAG: ABC transporter ATP-binding protein [Acidilobaceae archaeon]